MIEVAVLGAGPYGLATAAFLRHAGVEVKVFGEPMESWRRNMPTGMLLRSHRRASHIAAPNAQFGIDSWAASVGAAPAEPMSIDDFVGYGRWYQQEVIPDLVVSRVRSVDLVPDGFSLSLEDGEQLEARRVVVAAGIVPFAYWPEQFVGLPDELVTHSSMHTGFESFKGRSVLILGAGQSALETAALLREAGAEPRLLARAASISWLAPHDQQGTAAALTRAMMPPTGVGGRVTGWLAATPGLLRRYPARLRSWVGKRCMAPAGADWLRERLEGVPTDLGHRIDSIRAEGGELIVELDDARRLGVDRLILCTGYRVDVSRYEFLAAGLLARLERANGAPRLGVGLESSSLPGLHFAGAPASGSFGPIMRFVVGTWYAAPAIAHAITPSNQHPVHVAYRPRLRAKARGSASGQPVGNPL